MFLLDHLALQLLALNLIDHCEKRLVKVSTIGYGLLLERLFSLHPQVILLVQHESQVLIAVIGGRLCPNLLLVLNLFLLLQNALLLFYKLLIKSGSALLSISRRVPATCKLY